MLIRSVTIREEGRKEVGDRRLIMTKNIVVLVTLLHCSSPPLSVSVLTVRARESCSSPLTSFPVCDDSGSEMAPHPVRDVDMERKEELILAKQLRAARVTILSRVGSRLEQTRILITDICFLSAAANHTS